MGVHRSCCQQWHEELPMSYGSDAPALFYGIPEAERDHRVELSSDQCIIDGRYFFVLANIEIPRP